MTDSYWTIETAAATDRGRRRAENEDAYFCDASIGIFMVADGMGGANAGEVASAMSVDKFVGFLEPFLGDEDATIPFELQENEDSRTTVLMQAALSANSAVYEKANEDPDHRGMGSTLTAAIVFHNDLYITHIGDSRCYRIRTDTIDQITADHSKVQEMVSQGLLTEEAARSHPQRNIITRCIGRKKKLKPDIFTIDFDLADTFLLCSDGLNDMVPDDVIHRIVTESLDLEIAATRLVNAANDRGGRDNITVVLLRFVPESTETIDTYGDQDQEN